MKTILFAVAASLQILPVLGATYVFQEGLNGYAGTRDTYVQQVAPDSSAGGSDIEIRVDTSPAGGGSTLAAPEQGLLRFEDLFGVSLGQVPLGSTIESATLRLNTSNTSPGPIGLYRMTLDWNESATWNSLVDGVTPGIDALLTPTQVFAPTELGLTSLDVTADVQAWSSGQANYGWALLTEQDNGWDFASSEAGVFPPELTINLAAIPEPSTMALWLSGLAICLCLRRPARRHSR
jgi:hypothetical protein